MPIDALDLALKGAARPDDALLLVSLGRLFGGGSKMTVFDDRIGIHQGRIAPTGVDPDLGDFVMALGSDVEGIFGDLALGDFARVDQEIDVTGDDLIRFGLSFRSPSLMPAGLAWSVLLLIDGVERVSVTGWNGRTRKVSDLALPVAALSGTVTVSVMLKIVSTP